jgi:hypothetical protein
VFLSHQRDLTLQVRFGFKRVAFREDIGGVDLCDLCAQRHGEGDYTGEKDGDSKSWHGEVV